MPSVGETNLNKCLCSMNPELDPETYVFCTVQNVPPEIYARKPRMVFQESEGRTTLILTQQLANDFEIFDSIYPCRRIILNVHSSLDCVGFLARITNHLASSSSSKTTNLCIAETTNEEDQTDIENKIQPLNPPISVNAVSAFHHDHLFVPEDRAEDAMERLYELMKIAQQQDEEDSKEL